MDRKKKFILALQPHEVLPNRTDRSPWNKTLAFCAGLILLMGLAFPMNNPDQWKELERVGLLRYAYGWQTSPLISPVEATEWYSDMFGKVPKTGCLEAQKHDWELMCYVLTTSGMDIDCVNANLQSKTAILRNMEKSKTTEQYACLYEN